MQMKKVLSILLVAVMLLSVIPLSAYAASSGTFNTGLSWNIDDDGLLTFSGSGAIPTEGFERNADVKKVIINNSVTEIGSYAFFFCGNLTEVDIQNPSVSLPSNTASQFSRCNNLTTVTIPEGVTIITYSMFRDCSSLTTIKLPSTITTICGLAFYNSGLQSISIPEGATFGNAYESPFETNTLQSLTLEGSSPMTFTGNELTYLTGAVTVYIPEGSVYEDPGTTSLAVNDALEDEDEIEYAQDSLEDAKQYFEDHISSYGMTPEEALQEVNAVYSWGETPMYMIITTEPCTVTLNEGDTCEPVFGSATIGRYVPAPTTHTITWKNWDGTTLETDTEIEEGATPTYDGATPTKADDAQYTYTFAGWTPEVVAVTGDATYTAQFTPVAKFSVFVKKLTGGTINVSNVTGLTTVAQLKDLLVTETGVPASAMRLIFAGKQLEDDKTLGEYNIQKESTIHLVIRTYTITWKSDENTVIDTTNVAYGETPAHADAAGYEDADYTYTFAGWTPEVTAVTGEATYTAVYSQSVRQYTVTWKNYDDSVIGTSTVNAGQTPEFSDSIGQIKAKPADENHSYEFTGWTPEIVAAEADAEYTATFVDVLSISNVDEWNSFAASVKDGNTYSGKIVRMTADVGPVTTMVAGTFSGTFDGGSHTLTVNISGGNASVATFEVVKDATIQNLTLAGSITSSGIHSAALVKSISDSGTSCTIKNVDIYADVNCAQNYIGGFIGHAGTANTVNIENSIFAGSINKTGSGQGGYIGGFIGWSQQLTATIDNCAFTGSYSNIKSFNNIGFSYNAPTKITVNDFYSNVSEVFGTSANHGTRLYTPSSSYPTTVALVNHGGEKTFFHQLSDALNAWVDGSTLMLMSDVTTASTISVGGNKTLDLNGYKLRISRNAQVISVQGGGDLTIKSSAQGGEVIGSNADNAVVGGKGQTLTLESGTIKTPASNAISGTNAVFNLNGGAIECTSNSSDMTVASAVYCKGNCTVNWNGTSITTNTGCGFYSRTTTDTVKIGGGSFAATADTLPDNAGYALSNFNVEIQGAPVLNGKGIYLSNGRVINVTGELTNDVPIGVVMQTPGVFTSGLQGNGGITNFANGNGDDYGIGLDASGEAQLVRKYTVTWKLDETTVLATDKVLEGTVPTFTGTAPADYSDTYYTYSFSGWTPAPVAATEDATYTAAFTATAKTFTVFVKTLTGKTIFVYDVTGETTAAQIKDMLVQETGLPAAQQRLIFAGKEMANDKTLADYNIQKESTIHCVPVGYTVTWLNYDGSELVSTSMAYGATPEYTGETPQKPDDATNYYTFSGWTPEVSAVTGDATYTATYTATPKPVSEEPDNGYFLTIDEKVGVNFAIDVEAYDAEGGTIVVEGVNENAESSQKFEKSFDIDSLSTYTGGNYDGDSVLNFDVAPAQIAEIFTLRIYNAQGELKGELEKSVLDYANSMKDDAVYGELMTSLINYGRLAAEYFNYAGGVADIPVLDGCKEELTNSERTELLARREASLTQGNASFDGMVYFAKVEPEFKFYFAGTNVGTAQLGADSEGLSVNLTKTDNGVAAKVTGFKASDFGKTFTVTVDGTTLTINGYAYIASALGNANLKALATGLFRYAQAAEEVA